MLLYAHHQRWKKNAAFGHKTVKRGSVGAVYVAWLFPATDYVRI
jgi:hypothetical protein